MRKTKLKGRAKQMKEINRIRNESQNFMGLIIIISMLVGLAPFLINSQRIDFLIILLSIIALISLIFAYIIWYLLKRLDF